MSDPTLSLCMIVKDEERYLGECLESVQGVVDEIVVVDTGSTDQTVAIAERYGAKVVHSPWTGDFAAARNVSLDHATCDWILVLDADERLEASSQERLKALLAAPDVAGYSLICENLVANGEQSQRAPVFRLLRNRPDIRFEGMIHEQAIPSAKRTGMRACESDVTIVHLGYVAEEVARRDKRQRNLTILERQVAAEPNNPFVRFNLGEVLKLLGRQKEAESAYRSALQLLKASCASHGVSYYANLYFSLADLYRELGHFDEAHALLDEAIALYPRFADLHYVKGFTYFDADRYDEAIAQFAACPRHAEVRHPFATDPGIVGHKAFRAMADCHIKQGNREAAQRCMEEALRLHPNPDAALFANLGILMLESGAEADARRYFEKAIAQDPHEVRSWLNLLLLWLQAEDYAAVIAAWPSRPADPTCEALMLLAFALTGRAWPVEPASDDLLVQAWSAVLEFALSNDRTDLVQAVLDRLDELGAAFPTLEVTLGELFVRQGLPELALGAFLRAQQRAPHDPRVYRGLGDASLAAGQIDDARTMYSQALELSPEDAQLEHQLKQLESARSL